METILYFYQTRQYHTPHIATRKINGQTGEYYLITADIPFSFWEKEEAGELLGETLEEHMHGQMDALGIGNRKRPTEEVVAGTDIAVYVAWDTPDMGKLQRWLARQRFFSWRPFSGYRDLPWAEELMPCSRFPEYRILGFAPCICELLRRHADRIHTVQWTLTEAVCNARLRGFVEDYYDETGILITLQVCPPFTPLPSPQTTKPVTVLDFSGQRMISVRGLAAGSVWLDMDSDEKKRRRIGIQNPGISYFSLKNNWKQGL